MFFILFKNREDKIFSFGYSFNYSLHIILRGKQGVTIKCRPMFRSDLDASCMTIIAAPFGWHQLILLWRSGIAEAVEAHHGRQERNTLHKFFADNANAKTFFSSFAQKSQCCQPRTHSPNVFKEEFQEHSILVSVCLRPSTCFCVRIIKLILNRLHLSSIQMLMRFLSLI